MPPIKKLVQVSLSLLVLCCCNLAIAAPGMVAVTGKGKVEVQPDQITIAFVVGNSEIKDLVQAKDNVETRAKNIAQALIKLGVKEEDISSPFFEVNSERQFYGPDNNQEWVPTVRRHIEVKLKKVKHYRKALDAIVDNGATRIDRVTPDIQQPEQYKQEALTKAIADAKQQAQFLAQSFDTRLGKIHNIGERQYRDNFQMRDVMMAKPARAQDPEGDQQNPYEFKPAKVSIEADIFVEFELDEDA